MDTRERDVRQVSTTSRCSSYRGREYDVTKKCPDNFKTAQTHLLVIVVLFLTLVSVNANYITRNHRGLLKVIPRKRNL